MARYVHKFECTITNGKPVLDNATGFLNECRQLEGKRCVVTVSPVRKQKSNQQQRYYRGVVVQRFAEYWGCSNDEAHRALSREHLTVIPANKEMPSYIRSTELGEWTTTEWEDYMEFLRTWGLIEFGIYIEKPNEVVFEDIKTVW